MALFFPEMLVEPAKKAGMKVPKDVDNYDQEKYPHFFVYCTMQLGTPMPFPGCHWDNAKIVASIPVDKIKKVTVFDLKEMGFAVGHPIP
ncbi:hypothetical protein C4565_00415 [Candidatus Parcubacteria bacterium]|nr:MAG: hypothetical protein C4565_00415 [Candidatus Parcubacteria bacterium]